MNFLFLTFLLIAASINLNGILQIHELTLMQRNGTLPIATSISHGIAENNGL